MKLKTSEVELERDGWLWIWNKEGTKVIIVEYLPPLVVKSFREQVKRFRGRVKNNGS